MRLVLIFLIVGLCLWLIFLFNRLVRLRNRVRNAWADIDVQLTRRHDLVPQLVVTVKGYAEHESALLESVTVLRGKALQQRGATQKGQVEAELEQAVGRLLALHEGYPDLKANENFLQLQRDLVDVEDHLQYARRFYNGAVRDHNNSVQRFPDMLIARVAGFRDEEFYQAKVAERAAVSVGMRP